MASQAAPVRDAASRSQSEMGNRCQSGVCRFCRAVGKLSAGWQTFTSAQQVALAVVSAQANWVPEWAKEQATAALFQGGISVDGALITDGYDTVAANAADWARSAHV